MMQQNIDNIDPKMYILNENNIYITKQYIETTLEKHGIQYKVNDLGLFQIAMTHNSYLNKDISMNKINKTVKFTHGKDIEPLQDIKNVIPLQETSYERLEFVGDSIIHLVLAKYLWARYESQDEGFMTRLRTKIEKGTALAELALSIGLNKYIIIARIMEKNGCREKNTHVLEDAFEAFIAALFIDSKENYMMCNNFIISLIEREIDIAELLHLEDNYKDILLQYFHQEKWQDPIYDVLDISGPDHKKQFTVYVKRRKMPQDDGEIVGTGIASSKKKGEQDAALEALKYFNIIKTINESDSETESGETFSDINSDEEIIIIDDDSVDDKNYKLLKKI